MSIVFTSFKHPKLPISIKIPVPLLQIVYLHDSYISKFMNYLFANLLVAWLYHICKQPGLRQVCNLYSFTWDLAALIHKE